MHMQARQTLLFALRDAVKPHTKAKNIGLISRQDLAQSAPLLAVLESPLLFSLMQELMVRASAHVSLHMTHLRGCISMAPPSAQAVYVVMTAFVEV